MSTRSAIGLLIGDKVKSIYCHFDGYLSHNGRILLKYYDETKLKELLDLGDISSLGINIGPKQDFTNFMPKEEGTEFPKYCRSYGRDYEEENAEAEILDLDEFVSECKERWCEYFYLMKNGKWFVTTDGNKWEELDRAIVLDTLLQD